MKIEGVPDGYELVRIGQPQVGETIIDGEGVITNSRHNWSRVNLPIVRKIEPPKPIEAPQGYRLLEPHEKLRNWDMYLSDSGWIELLGGKEEYAQTHGFTYARKVEPKVRPMTRSEFLAAWKQRGFCPLIDHEDDIDVVNQVTESDPGYDDETVSTYKHGWVALATLSAFKFASDETYLTVEE